MIKLQGKTKMRDGRGAMGIVGVALGLGGAVLDWYSGYILIANSSMTPGGMGVAQSSGPGLVWGVGVVALGLVLAVTAAVMALRAEAVSMGDAGALMVVYGLVMLFIGASMYLGLTSMMQGTYFPALGMVALGGLMVANGALMRRSSIM